MQGYKWTVAVKTESVLMTRDLPPSPPPPRVRGFGGALDGAARHFTEGYDSGLIPMEFVNSMCRQHLLIPGIGHKVKSVSGLGCRLCSSYLN